MCKPPRPGATKTRLARSVGADGAAQLSRAFLVDCASAAGEAAKRAGLTTVAFYRPADAAAEIGAILGPDWDLVHAEAGDLGATMHEALALLLARCPDGALLMGADMPLIDSGMIAEAAGILRDGGTRDIALIPSPDGGYCLIGIRCAKAAAPLFTPMAWGGPDVLAHTLRRAAANHLTIRSLAPLRDIDDGDDLDWLRAELTIRPDAAPATRAALFEMASGQSGPGSPEALSRRRARHRPDPRSRRP
jgi:rSAM/selenodomain-associated transferase 1